MPTRKQHEEGVKHLNKIFGWTPAAAMNPRGAGKRGLARHVRQIAHESRRLNDEISRK